MATFYVSTSTGNSGNNGTSPLTPWATLTYALGGTTAVASGDTIYVAPGVYRQNVVVGITNPTANIKIIGSTDGSIFTNVPVGYVRITSATTDNGSYSGQTFTGTTKNYIWLENLLFEGSVQLLTSANMTFTNCSFYGPVYITSPSGLASNATINKCIFVYTGVPVGNGLALYIQNTGTSVAGGNVVQSCIFNNYYSPAQGAILFGDSTGNLIYNCSFFGAGSRAIWATVANCVQVYNSLFCGHYTTAALGAGASGQITSNYNRFVVSGTVAVNTTVGANSITSSASIGVDFGSAYQFGLPPLQPLGSYASSPNLAVGTATGALAFDTFGKAWSGATPDAGGVTYAPIGTTSFYFPTERNASTITIAPGSTSQSIELYLGATGLTASTSGLSARYNRTRTASVSIPLVARTIAQAWTAGGFAEVDATNMPGVYRLDLPDAALAAGADDVTVVVRGASGTNGAVMTIKLSSGGLTSAQTASAVWGASPAGYVTETDFGGVLNAIRNVAGNTEIIAQDIPANVWDELKTNHTIPNTFGDYLDTKVSTGADTSRIQLRQGPFLIKQNAIDSVITEVNQFLSTVPNIEMVLIDSSGGSVSVAGATLVMRVRNQAGTAVVNNVTPAVAYADGGVIRWSPNLSWTALGVTTAGTYRIVVERTMSGVTTTFGPFLVQLSSG